MQVHVFIAVPFDIEIAVTADTYTEAHRKAWSFLSKEQQDNCEYLDYVDNYIIEEDGERRD